MTRYASTRTHIRTVIAVAIALLLAFGVFVWGVTAAPVSAAPYQPATGGVTCRAGSFEQNDMAGVYESSQMMLEVYPCGGSTVFWMNSYGEHQSVYLSVDRLPGGGLLTEGYMPDAKHGGYLDSLRTLAIKPAEKGWIQVATITDDDHVHRIYRLMKTR